jgi:hypothetical protein
VEPTPNPPVTAALDGPGIGCTVNVPWHALDDLDVVHAVHDRARADLLEIAADNDVEPAGPIHITAENLWVVDTKNAHGDLCRVLVAEPWARAHLLRDAAGPLPEPALVQFTYAVAVTAPTDLNAVVEAGQTAV